MARGTGVVAATGPTGRPPTAGAGLGPWITGNGIDACHVTALAADGYRQVVVPASQLSSTPANGSTTAPFAVSGARGVQLTAMASDDDLTARFTSDPGDPVLAAHQLVAELAQLYYERPNGVTPGPSWPSPRPRGPTTRPSSTRSSARSTATRWWRPVTTAQLFAALPHAGHLPVGMPPRSRSAAASALPVAPSGPSGPGSTGSPWPPWGPAP